MIMTMMMMEKKMVIERDISERRLMADNERMKSRVIAKIVSFLTILRDLIG